jgi:hypothetical protein
MDTSISNDAARAAEDASQTALKQLRAKRPYWIDLEAQRTAFAAIDPILGPLPLPETVVVLTELLVDKLAGLGASTAEIHMVVAG